MIPALIVAGSAGFGLVVGFLVRMRMPGGSGGSTRARLYFAVWALVLIAGAIVVSWALAGMVLFATLAGLMLGGVLCHALDDFLRRAAVGNSDLC